MITLSHGFKKPENSDSGQAIFPAMELNIEKMNDHTHNGVNSARLTTGAIEPLTQDILAADWGVLTNGHYAQNVTMPGGLEFDKVSINVQTAGGERVFPTIKKLAVNQYAIYVNDATLALKVVYV